jgi:hypothetical protein
MWTQKLEEYDESSSDGLGTKDVRGRFSCLILPESCVMPSLDEGNNDRGAICLDGNRKGSAVDTVGILAFRPSMIDADDERKAGRAGVGLGFFKLEAKIETGGALSSSDKIGCNIHIGRNTPPGLRSAAVSIPLSPLVLARCGSCLSHERAFGFFPSSQDCVRRLGSPYSPEASVKADKKERLVLSVGTREWCAPPLPPLLPWLMESPRRGTSRIGC